MGNSYTTKKDTYESRVKESKKIILFKVAMNNGKFLYTDSDGIDELYKEEKEEKYAICKGYKLYTDVYAVLQNNIVINTDQVCYAIPGAYELVLEGDFDNA